MLFSTGLDKLLLTATPHKTHCVFMRVVKGL